jgi:hypothetical protein
MPPPSQWPSRVYSASAVETLAVYATTTMAWSQPLSRRSCGRSGTGVDVRHAGMCGMWHVQAGMCGMWHVHRTAHVGCKGHFSKTQAPGIHTPRASLAVLVYVT